MSDSDYDFTMLADSYSDSLDVLDEITAIFLEETPDRVDNLKQAASKGDFETVQRVAHGLANTTGTLRADAALRKAREIEALARQQSRDGLGDRIAELEEVIEEILRQVREYKNGR